LRLRNTNYSPLFPLFTLLLKPHPTLNLPKPYPTAHTVIASIIPVRLKRFPRSPHSLPWPVKSAALLLHTHTIFYTLLPLFAAPPLRCLFTHPLYAPFLSQTRSLDVNLSFIPHPATTTLLPNTHPSHFLEHTPSPRYCYYYTLLHTITSTSVSYNLPSLQFI